MLRPSTQSLLIVSEQDFNNWFHSWAEDYLTSMAKISCDIFETKLARHVKKLSVNDFLLTVMSKRFKFYQVEIEEIVLLILASLSQNVSDVVMLTAVSAHYFSQFPNEVFDVETFRDIFETRDLWSLPHEEFWEAQKSDQHHLAQGNLLDLLSAKNFIKVLAGPRKE